MAKAEPKLLIIEGDGTLAGSVITNEKGHPVGRLSSVGTRVSKSGALESLRIVVNLSAVPETPAGEPHHD